MVGWITSNNSKITNFFVGSTARSLLESVTIEIESLYYQMYKGFKQASEDSIYNSFNFPRLGAQPSTGVIKFKFRAPLTAPLVISAGYKLATTSIAGVTVYFQTVVDLLVPIGSVSATTDIVCTEPGLIGNVPANTIKLALSRITIIEDINNDSPLIDGRLMESVEDRKKRFTMFINTLPRGTVSSVLYGCLLVPEVTGASVDDQIGVVKAYVHNAAGDLPATVRNNVKAKLIDYKPAGIEVLVLPVLKRITDLNIQITLHPEFDSQIYSTLVITEMTKYLNGYTVSKPLIRAELIRFIMSIDESAISNTTISLSSDVIVSNSELVRPGVITVTVIVG